MTQQYHDEKAEWRFLATMMVQDYVRYVNGASEALFTEQRKHIYRAMVDSYMDYGAVTFESISLKLGKVPPELLAAQASNPHILFDELARLARKRILLEKAEELKQLSREHDPSMDDVMKKTMVMPITGDEDSSLLVGTQEALGVIHAKRNGHYKFARTGLKFLDKRLGGEYKPRTVNLFNAPAGTGKTALILQSMYNMATMYGIPSLFFSLEMAKADLMPRLWSNICDIDYAKIQSADITDNEARRIEEVANYINTLPMYIIDSTSRKGMTFDRMIHEVRRHVMLYNIRVVNVDFLQLMNPNFTGNRNTDLGLVILRSKDEAVKHDITFNYLSQITAGKEGLYSTRESGDAVNIADGSLLMHRVDDEEDMNIVAPNGKVLIEVDMPKNRFGIANKKMLVTFDGSRQRFEDD